MADLTHDPILRQKYRFSRDGDVLLVEIWAEPGGATPEHHHPAIEERFEVLEGEVTFKIDGRAQTAGPGMRVVAKPGVPHAFENTGKNVAYVRAEVEPAGRIQEFLEEGAALNRSGKFSKRATPKGPRALLLGAEFMVRYRPTIVLHSPPALIQRLLFPPLARLARRRGAGSTTNTV
jgi:mannose-6-phosphate isomerase-like protein (cupin superfamily)